MKKKVKITTYLPLAYNDGTPIAPAIRESILFQAAMQFGGYSLQHGIRGGWRNDKGMIFQEVNDRLDIVCDTEMLEELREWVIEIGRLLHQEAMYFEVADSNVEILDSRE